MHDYIRLSYTLFKTLVAVIELKNPPYVFNGRLNMRGFEHSQVENETARVDGGACANARERLFMYRNVT